MLLSTSTNTASASASQFCGVPSTSVNVISSPTGVEVVVGSVAVVVVVVVVVDVVVVVTGGIGASTAIQVMIMSPFTVQLSVYVPSAFSVATTVSSPFVAITVEIL